MDEKNYYTGMIMPDFQSHTYSLPFGDPAVFWFAGTDHTLKVGGGTVVHVVAVVLQVQECLTIVTAIVFPLLKGLEKNYK